MQVGQDAFFRGCDFHGVVSFVLARMAGDLYLDPMEKSGHQLAATFRSGVNFRGAEIGGEFSADKAQFLGHISDFEAVQVGHGFHANGAIFAGSVYFTGMAVKDNFYLDPFGGLKTFKTLFMGPANFSRLEVGGVFNADQAIFKSESTIFSGLKVGQGAFFIGTVFFGGLVLKEGQLTDLVIRGLHPLSVGGLPLNEIVLNRTRIAHRLTIRNIEVKRFEARSLEVKGPVELVRLAIKDEADWRDASLYHLQLVEPEWPAPQDRDLKLYLDGLTYKSLTTKREPYKAEKWQELLDWLGCSRFNAQNYSQLDAFFRARRPEEMGRPGLYHRQAPGIGKAALVAPGQVAYQDSLGLAGGFRPQTRPHLVAGPGPGAAGLAGLPRLRPALWEWIGRKSGPLPAWSRFRGGQGFPAGEPRELCLGLLAPGKNPGLGPGAHRPGGHLYQDKIAPYRTRMMLKEAIYQVVHGHDLNEAEMTRAMEIIMSGEATEAQIGSFITALRMKGETVAEITAAARVMRTQATRIPISDGLIGLDRDEINVDRETVVDTCGTGGDATSTFNVSTTTAFVVAGAGLKVAKHGNRAVSSRCGSADVIEALGINLSLTPEQVAWCILEVGIGFLFAPQLHGSMRYAIGPRREIGIRTIFNILGPLTNPADANVQVLGVYEARLTEPLAQRAGEAGGQERLCGLWRRLL